MSHIDLMVPVNLRMEFCHWHDTDIDRCRGATSVIIGQPPLHTNYDYQNDTPLTLSERNAAGCLQAAGDGRSV